MEEAFDLGTNNLIVAIICQAIKDWKSLVNKELEYVKRKKSYNSKDIYYCGETFESIINFFNSDYGFYVCDAANVAPDRVVSWMQSYRKNMIDSAMKKGKKSGKR